MALVTTIDKLNHVLIWIEQELLKRSAQIPAMHRLHLALSPEICQHDPATVSGGCQWDSAMSAQRLSSSIFVNDPVDLVVCPLIIGGDQEIRAWLSTVEEWLPGGGWWLFATIVRGSFPALSSILNKQNEANPFLDMESLLGILTHGRAMHPIVDCARFQIEYKDSMTMVNDFFHLTGREILQAGWQSLADEVDNTYLEIAFSAVKVAPQVRKSMHTIQTRAILSHG